MAAPNLNDTASCTSRVELSISCHHLINLDVLSKSDPLVVVYDESRPSLQEVGRTEMIKNNLNPKFLTSITVDYRFEEVQRLRFVCYDVDNPHGPLSSQDFIGEMRCNLSEIITARGQIVARELHHPNHPRSKRGTIVITAEELKDVNDTVKFQLCARHLDKKDFFGKSDPFVTISRQQGSQWTPVYKSDVIKNTLDPSWMPFSVTMQKLCNGDHSRLLQFEVFDWNKSSSPELIGTFKVTVAQLLAEKREYELVDENKKMKKQSYKNSGFLRVLECQVVHTPSFIEYLRGGCELSLVVAIDFTASNGNPNTATSLHNITNPEPNEYVKAITTVGEILSVYDHDKMFPVYGFGAKIPPSGVVSHCFPLNGNPQQPEVPGVQGILNSYYTALSSVTLYGPTMFSEILKASMFIANQTVTQQVQRYFILLILTDGVINDMDDTIDKIVEATNIPLSVIIVGVGNADFANMRTLDADDAPLRSRTGAAMARDIVQFVPFRDFKNQPLAALARETLAEIPTQLLQYMTCRRIVPNKALVATESTLNVFASEPSISAGLTNASAPPPSAAQSLDLNYPQFTLSQQGPPISPRPPTQPQESPFNLVTQPQPLLQQQPPTATSQPPTATGYPQQLPTGTPQPSTATGYPQQPPTQSGYPQQPPTQSGYPQQPPTQSGYPQQQPTQSGYPQQPPTQSGYPPQQPPTQSGYPHPPQQAPTQSGYTQQPPTQPSQQTQQPPTQSGYPQQPPTQSGYPQQPPTQSGYPPQQPPATQSGYPPQQPPQSGYPQQPPAQGGYPPQQAGYPPSQPGCPPQPGYPPQPQQPGAYPQQPQPGYPPPQQQGYPPQQPGYPPPQQQGYSPQPQQGYPPPQNAPGQQPGGYPPQQPGQPSWYPPQQSQQPAWYPPQNQPNQPWYPQSGYPPQQPVGYPPQPAYPTANNYPPAKK